MPGIAPLLSNTTMKSLITITILFITLFSFGQELDKKKVRAADLQGNEEDKVLFEQAYSKTNWLDGSSQVKRNALFIQQSGNNHSYVARQEHTGMAGINMVASIQYGAYNHTSISQKGSGIKSGTFQKGANNNMDLSINGNDVVSLHGQKGNYNTIDESYAGNGLDPVVIQSGNHNLLLNQSSGRSLPGMRIEQRGNDMKLIIK